MYKVTVRILNKKPAVQYCLGITDSKDFVEQIFNKNKDAYDGYNITPVLNISELLKNAIKEK
tara:strand:- start:403 stop:588 length:186 start_codon:yes stop_codon:yes gene_type:complete